MHARTCTAETGTGFDFDATRAGAHRPLAETSSPCATVTGGTHDRQVAYYTALYHAMLHPNLAGDVDGSYMGFDGTVHRASGYTPRQNFSLWDTYRTQNQLLELLAPQVARDDALSLLAIGREGGWLPRWALADSETNIMTGDPVTADARRAVVEGLPRRARARGVPRCCARTRRSCRRPTPSTTAAPASKYYDKLGYLPYGLKRGTDCPDHGGDNDCAHPASATLEYSAADAALSTMAARRSATDADATMFAQRGRWYRNLWDRRIDQFRPRLTDGTFLRPYDPVSGNDAFHESGAYQYAWLVPQDPAGLVELMGGRRPPRSGSTASSPTSTCSPTRPAPRARTGSARAYDYYAKTTYNPNNEPDLLAPYLYLWSGEPYKTATVHPRRVHPVHHRRRRHDRQRRPRRDVGLVRHELARPVPDDERRQRASC